MGAELFHGRTLADQAIIYEGLRKQNYLNGFFLSPRNKLCPSEIKAPSKPRGYIHIEYFGNNT